MNVLELLFVALGLFVFITGLITNYGKSMFPRIAVDLFRYGRANTNSVLSSPSFVKTIQVPKRWFYHFYLYAVLLQLSVVITVISTYTSGSNGSWLVNLLDLVGDRRLAVSATTTVIASSIFLFHLSRRLYETLFVCIYSGTTMNVFHYLLGFTHYTAAILCLVAHGPKFASTPSTASQFAINLSQLGMWEFSWVSLFFIGNYLQNRAHVGLANLRKGKDKETRGHKIPRGELFEYISCPNYFAEILIYCALTGLCRFQNSTLNYCTLWVIANQVIAGIMNHLWYVQTFKDYPKQRKAIIPFIW